jgi:hypothetical protein
MTPCRSLVLALAFLTLSCAPPALAQAVNVADTTSTPIPGVGHDYIRMLDETVNPANGSLSLRIQTPTPQGRGVTIPFGFAYDSTGVWYVQPSAGNGRNLVDGATQFTQQGPFSKGGWSYTLPHLSRSVTTFSEKKPQPDQSMYCSATTGCVFTDPSGTSHNLGLSQIYTYYTSAHKESTACMDSHYFESTTGGDSAYRAALSGASGLDR